MYLDKQSIRDKSHLLLSLWLCNTFTRNNLYLITTKASDWCRIWCACVTPAVVKPQNHRVNLWAISELSTLHSTWDLRNSLPTLLPISLFFSLSYGLWCSKWGVSLTSTGTQLCVCLSACLSVWVQCISPVMSKGSVTHITSQPLAELFISLHTHGAVMWRPHWHCSGA